MLTLRFQHLEVKEILEAWNIGNIKYINYVGLREGGEIK